jgi:hypothetical protein
MPPEALSRATAPGLPKAFAPTAATNVTSAAVLPAA